MNLKTVWNLGIKELRGLWRDPIMLVLIVYAFSLSIWTSSNAAPEALTNAAIGIVDESVASFIPHHGGLLRALFR